MSSVGLPLAIAVAGLLVLDALAVLWTVRGSSARAAELEREREREREDSARQDRLLAELAAARGASESLDRRFD